MPEIPVEAVRAAGARIARGIADASDHDHGSDIGYVLFVSREALEAAEPHRADRIVDTPAGPVPSDPECPQHWGQDCTARDWGHVCILPAAHTIDHLCVCKARIACVCICHEPEPRITSHHRPCCIDWVGGFWGKVGDAYPLIEARVRRDERARIVADLKRAAAGRHVVADAIDNPELLAEANVLDAAANLAGGDYSVMIALIPSWLWTDEDADRNPMPDLLRPQPDPATPKETDRG